MKKNGFLLLLSLFLVGTALNAQTIDFANFQCMYKLKYTKDFLNLDKKQTDEMMLLVGNKHTLFCSYVNYVADSLQEANPAEYAPQVANVGGGTKVMAAKTKNNLL